MAKKIVRGITDVKTINNQDFDTNNVNDLLSDGQYNYIHRKKGKTEEYHNLTDNIKTISSDNTDLLTVTNNNKTTNTATLHPKHDAQKEQVLESTRDTITINHGSNGTAEKTSVDVNFEKVQEKLTTGDGLAIENNEIKIKPKNVETLPANSGFYNGAFVDGEWGNPYTSISLNIDTNKLIQLAFRESVNTSGLIIGKYRFIVNNVATAWKEMALDTAYITSLLAQKQDVLTAGDGITIEGQTVDTNPQKVLEHENLISDSEYITLNHETGENATHIKTTALKEELDTLHQTKQDTLVAGDGITIQGQTISASGGGGETSSIEGYVQQDQEAVFVVYKHTITSGHVTLRTYTFSGMGAEIVLTGELKNELKKFVGAGITISNSALTLTNDGTNIKLINSKGTEQVYQQATFTFQGEGVSPS